MLLCGVSSRQLRSHGRLRAAKIHLTLLGRRAPWLPGRNNIAAGASVRVRVDASVRVYLGCRPERVLACLSLGHAPVFVFMHVEEMSVTVFSIRLYTMIFLVTHLLSRSFAVGQLPLTVEFGARAHSTHYIAMRVNCY